MKIQSKLKTLHLNTKHKNNERQREKNVRLKLKINKDITTTYTVKYGKKKE